MFISDGYDTMGSTGSRRKISRNARHQSPANEPLLTALGAPVADSRRNVTVHRSRDPIPGEEFNLKNFEKSLISSKETNV